jgi:Zn finger protein HypA/HybF involved in hydrogenase expression
MSTIPFQYRCPNCPQKLHAEPKHVGFRARCPRCGQVHTVPNPDDPFLVGADDATKKIPAPAAPAADNRAAGGINPFAQFEKSVHGLARSATPTPEDAAPRVETRSNVFRRCPACKRVIPVDNQWAGLICGHCGAEVPGT